MGLAHFEPETKEVKFKSKGDEFSFVVRGLNLVDLSYLVGQHIADIEAAFILFTEARTRIIATGRLDGFLIKLCQDAPTLVAEVISVAADEREHVERYAKIPFSVTAVALSYIMELTMVEQGGLKNLSASLLTLMEQGLPESAREALEALRQPPSNGSIGESGTT